MSEIQNPKQYDLEERTLEFSKLVIRFCRGSAGANYIEANESLSKKDFLARVKICRKEAKESGYWLKLVETNNLDVKSEQGLLLKESIELMKIFGSILAKNQ